VLTSSYTLDDRTEPFIKEIYRIIELVANDGLTFNLSVDKTHVLPNESLSITFKVTNTNVDPMNFNLKSTQTHDIYIKNTSKENTNEAVWNWANQQTFKDTQNNRALPGNSSSELSYVWNCLDNQGNRVSGQFAISAELLSWPGGITKDIIVTVDN
jgi:hypothetical protein